MSDFCPKRRMWIRSLQSFKTNTDFVMCLRKWVQKLFEIPTACILFGWNTYHVDWTFTGKSTLFLISIHPKSYILNRPILALSLRVKVQIGTSSLKAFSPRPRVLLKTDKKTQILLNYWWRKIVAGMSQGLKIWEGGGPKIWGGGTRSKAGAKSI